MKNVLIKNSLSKTLSVSYILSYKEDVSQLEKFLAAENLNPEVIRASYTEEELQYSRATRCLMNHYAAWVKATQHKGYSLICESDFVPCIGLGDMPAFWPSDDPTAWGYLYTGSPRLIAILGKESFLRVQMATTVAYVVNAKVASILIEFFKDITQKHGMQSYRLWDTEMQWFAMGQGAAAYMPYRSYGEHGGLPNPEHAVILKNEGRHRADILAGPLCFLPPYALGSRLKYLKERTVYRIFGWLRLLTGRWIISCKEYPLTSADRLRMYLLGMIRLLKI